MSEAGTEGGGRGGKEKEAVEGAEESQENNVEIGGKEKEQSVGKEKR